MKDIFGRNVYVGSRPTFCVKMNQWLFHNRHSDFTAADILAALPDHKEGQVRGHITGLFDDGYLVRIKKGLYRVDLQKLHAQLDSETD